MPTRSSDEAAAILDAVPRETRAKLELYAAELARWQRVKNLVGASTLADLWTRHFADSLQLAELATGATWVDLGTGAGFPGLVLAIRNPTSRVILVESDARKCAFLRHIVRLTNVRAEVVDGRIEDVLPALEPPPEVVTARALAPLTDLLRLARPALRGGTVGLFPKGREHEAELTRARESWRFDADILPSRIDPDGRVLRITNLSDRIPANPQRQ